jgi:S1-C subfamily serine protease
LVDVVSAVGPSVIGLGRGARAGSGVVVDADRVLTLAHHLRGEEVEVRFRDGRAEDARLIGTDPDLDLAILEVTTGDAPPITWAEDGTLAIGTRVFALGDPGGAGLRATHGAISAEPTRLRGRRGRPVDGVLEHTAPLPRGSGGGPLADGDGRLLGVNALRQPGGFILALPTAVVRPRVEALLEGRAAGPRQLGVAIVPPRAARRMRRAVGLPERDGLLVRAVVDGTPAAAAGVQRGDLLIALGEQQLTGMDALYAALDAAAPGQPVGLSVVRGSDEAALTVTFPAAEATAGEAA